MKDQIVLVTGGAGNVGRAVTRALLERGARVAVPCYKSDQRALAPLHEEFGDQLFDFALDLTTERGADLAIRELTIIGGLCPSASSRPKRPSRISDTLRS